MNFAHFEGLYLGNRIDPVIVCHLDKALAGQLGAVRGRVLMSDDTMAKQHLRHPDLSLEHYRVLVPTLMRGEYRQDTPRSAVISYTDVYLFGESFRAAVKVTQDGKRIYVVSFNRMRESKRKQASRKPFPVIREHD